MGIAIAQVGMSRYEFLDCTPKEFTAIWEAHVENEERNFWNKMRVARFEVAKIMTGLAGKAVKETDVALFPGEHGYEAIQTQKEKYGVTSKDKFMAIKKRFGGTITKK